MKEVTKAIVKDHSKFAIILITMCIVVFFLSTRLLDDMNPQYVLIVLIIASAFTSFWYFLDYNVKDSHPSLKGEKNKK